jgi:hypothetical protein
LLLHTLKYGGGNRKYGLGPVAPTSKDTRNTGMAITCYNERETLI